MKKRHDWYYWRVIAVGCSFTLFGLGSLVLGYLVFPLISLGSSSPELATGRCRRLVQLSFQGFVGFITVMGVLTWSVSGRALLARPGQLIVANHPTLLDIVFLIAMVPNATCIVKSELYRNIFTRGPVSRAAYVANDTPNELVDDCVAALNSGASLVIFPEGTRSVNGQPGRFRRGAAYVMLAAQCPLALITIESRPPTLAKYEKWYKVPASRPHISLQIKDPADDNTGANPHEVAPSARELTGRWRDYFVNEATTWTT